MDFIDLIFALVGQWVPMKEDDYAKLKKEADDWKREQTDESDNVFGRIYAKFGRKWGLKLLSAVAYIPLYRWIGDYMNGAGKSPETDEDEF